MQKLQNRAARVVIKRDALEETFQLNWLNLESCRKIRKCVLVYKSLNGLVLVPEYLCNYFKFNHKVNHCNTRQRNNIHTSKCNLTVGKRTFQYSGSTIINTLPLPIRMLHH